MYVPGEQHDNLGVAEVVAFPEAEQVMPNKIHARKAKHTDAHSLGCETTLIHPHANQTS
jgi:hypothetical protein